MFTGELVEIQAQGKAQSLSSDHGSLVQDCSCGSMSSLFMKTSRRVAVANLQRPKPKVANILGIPV